MTTYDWSIKTLEHKVSDGGVIVAHWICSAKDGEYKCHSYGSENFTPNPDDLDFIPYEQLTEEDVLAWVWSQIDRDEIEAKLIMKINDQKTPQITTGVPW